MTFELFLVLFVALSTAGALVTEAAKKVIFDEKNLPSNLAALICSFVVGVLGVVIYSILTGIAIDARVILFAFVMGVCTAVGSMVGYDKVKQTIEQFRGGK